MTRLEILVNKSEEERIVEALDRIEGDIHISRLNASFHGSKAISPKDIGLYSVEYSIIVIYTDNITAHLIRTAVEEIKEELVNDDIKIFSIPFYDS